MVRGHLWGTSPFIGNHSVICSSISDVRVFGLDLPELPKKWKTIAKKAPIKQLLVNLGMQHNTEKIDELSGCADSLFDRCRWENVLNLISKIN